MEKIIKMIEFLKNIPSDINEHLQTLVEYSKECEHVTEFGTRSGDSTWMFLLYPKKIITYDIKYDPNVEKIKKVSEEYNINFEYILEDVLSENIEKTDLLFIDTLHRYAQLIMELRKHSRKVKKYIILHDTTSFAHKDEYLYDDASYIVKSKQTYKCGLKLAIKEFLETNDGKNWLIHKEYTNNNGLTILKRIEKDENNNIINN